jgi:hypothetical protein
VSTKTNPWIMFGCWTAILGAVLAFWVLLIAGVIWWLR